LPRTMPRNIWDWQSRSPPEAQTAHLAAARRIRSRLRPAEIYLVEEVLKARLFRCAGGKGEAARTGIVPLALRKPQERRTGSATPAVGLYRRIPPRTADPIRQTRI